MNNIKTLLLTALLPLSFQLHADLAIISPSPSCTNDAGNEVSDYAQLRDGTVIHLTTGLMWTQCSLGAVFFWQNDIAYCELTDVPTNQFTEVLNTSMTKPSTATSGYYRTAGHDDWRIPNVKELMSIVRSCDTADGFVNGEVFPSQLSLIADSGPSNARVRTNVFDTSTPVLPGYPGKTNEQANGSRYCLSMANTGLNLFPCEKTSAARVRLVRSATAEDYARIPQ